VPDDQLALAIGKEGLNARLATRLTGWKIDIQSETEFAHAEAEAAFAGAADDEEYSGRCGAILSNGKRCPNAALPGSRYCGVPAHQALSSSDASDANGAPEVVADDDTAAPAAVEAAESGEELAPVAGATEASVLDAVEDGGGGAPEQVLEPEAIAPQAAEAVTAPDEG